MSDTTEALQKAQVAAILKKVKAGKVLTQREERMLLDYQEGQKPEAERKTWVKGGKHAIAQRIGVDRRTINNWSKFDDFPKPRPNGDYALEDMVEWVKDRGLKGGEKPTISTLKERELAAKIEKLEFQLDVEKGKYILLEDAKRDSAQLAAEAKSVLQFKIERELPPQVFGIQIPEIEAMCKKAVDEVCEILSK